MSELKFYICKHCGNLVEMVHTGGGQLVCCGDPMVELKANTVDASQEKHVPVVTVEGDTVKVAVGAVAHPMLEEHYIQWVYLMTEHGALRHEFKPGDAPEATFCLNGEKALAAYEYCNLHGLWKKEL
ncbi:desulfoferrodoxin [Oscillibacter sp.]|uniref:desulfoferrodoxin n=1 Tax=Oscillibacter sp. TaxID=1945593 RepID=UPI00289B9A8F|nr:desulfoferrodoxin [Oscillibacter sp.]